MTNPLQFSSLQPWLGPLPAWVPEEDQIRIAAYQKYEEIFWSSEEGYVEVMRGDNDNPIFLPTAKTIVNTVDRYTAPGLTFQYMPVLANEAAAGDAATAADPEGIAIAQLAFDQMFAREQFMSRLNAEKKKHLIKGDWLFHIIGDDTKPLGRRIKILPVNPGNYFPVYEDQILEGGDPDKLIRVHLAEVIVINNQERISRLTYERLFDAQGVQTGIQVSHGIFDMQDWSAGTKSPERTIIPPTLLPATIPAIPIYHFKNGDPTERFGSSELRGLESVLLGINQTISDEDLALALEGLGLYATDGGPPIDENGNEVDWVMGPGRVMHHANGLERVNGVGSVTPYGDHYNRLRESMFEAAGLSDVAIGRVDSATAESGIALLLQLAPLLASTAPKDQHITDVLRQMTHDLCFWLTEYEELPLIVNGSNGPTPRVLVQPVIGDKVPKNQAATLEQVVALRSLIPPMISKQTAVEVMRAAGIPLAEDELVRLAADAAEQAALDAVAFGAVPDENADDRVDEELI